MKLINIFMIIIFDLDETLYQEKNFVISGFFEVSDFLFEKLCLNKKKTIHYLLETFNKYGRKKIFDKLLKEKNVYNKSLLKKVISKYRAHKPNISLTAINHKFLKKLSNKYNLYLVTDGNKIVQRNKIKSLKIPSLFKKIFITHQYGTINSKPSIYCFKKIKELENCFWKELIYIGDDPIKDFVNLNKKGVITVRLMRGRFAKRKVSKKYDAKYKINNLSDFYNLSLI